MLNTCHCRLWKQRKREIKGVEEHAGAPGELSRMNGASPLQQLLQRRWTCRGQRGLLPPLISTVLGLLLRLAAEVAVRRIASGGSPCLHTHAVIWASWLNRGTNFGREEREHLRIEGLLPPVVESLELQVGAVNGCCASLCAGCVVYCRT